MAALSLQSTGCYYGHLAAGQTRLLWARQPVDEVVASPKAPPSLRHGLETVARTRRHAASLGLDVGDQYTTYVAWKGDRVITTVVATRPGSVEIEPFWFPILGELPYKGFFDQGSAEKLAATLREKGLDVCVSRVDAYSTLGWLDDPVTQPMLQREDGPLVELVIHELTHTNVFLPQDPDLSESAATFIGQEASVSFFDDPEKRRQQRARVKDARQVAASLLAFRDDISELYAQDLPADRTSKKRAQLEAAMRERLAQLPLSSANASAKQRLAESIRLNDACLALRGTYHSDLPEHERVLVAEGGDLSGFIARLREAAREGDPRAAFFVTENAAPATVRRNSDGSGE